MTVDLAALWGDVGPYLAGGAPLAFALMRESAAWRAALERAASSLTGARIIIEPAAVAAPARPAGPVVVDTRTARA